MVWSFDALVNNTPIPISSKKLGADTIQNLDYVAAWGKGDLLGMVFSPDGTQVLVGSTTGIAIYDMHKLHQPPTWVPFEYPLIICF